MPLNNETSHGFRLALSADGTVLAIASVEDDAAGYVRVFELDGTGWEQLGQTITGETGTLFGISLALSEDGFTLAVAAPNHEVDEVETGLVRVYTLLEDAWIPFGEDILGNDVEVKAGLDVDLADNGNIVAVTSLGSANGQAAGTVQTYTYAAGLWIPLGNSLQGEAVGAGAQTTASTSRDGSRLAINRPMEGTVRVYELEVGVWKLLGTPITDAGTEAGVASTIELSDDGSIIAIGAPADNRGGTTTGAISVYALESGDWQLMGDPISGPENGDRLGETFGLSGDGRTVLTATPGLRLTSDPAHIGEARLYRFEGPQWSLAGNPIYGESLLEISGLEVALSSDGSTMAMTMSMNEDGTFVRAFDLSGLSTALRSGPPVKTLSVYPNPTHGEVTINGLLPSERILSASLQNLAGQVVQEQLPTKRTLHLPVPEGTYLLRVTTDAGVYGGLLTVTR